MAQRKLSLRIIPKTKIVDISQRATISVKKTANNKLVSRGWVMYAETTDFVSCFCCLCFDQRSGKSLGNEGCSVWAHLSAALKYHDSSSSRVKFCLGWAEAESRLRMHCWCWQDQSAAQTFWPDEWHCAVNCRKLETVIVAGTKHETACVPTITDNCTDGQARETSDTRTSRSRPVTSERPVRYQWHQNVPFETSDIRTSPSRPVTSERPVRDQWHQNVPFETSDIRTSLSRPVTSERPVRDQWHQNVVKWNTYCSNDLNRPLVTLTTPIDSKTSQR
jgi:hypothetical protein